MPGIRVKENEPFEVAIRRFKRTIEKVGLLPELRSREFYEKPTAERKRKLAAAVKRHPIAVAARPYPPRSNQPAPKSTLPARPGIRAFGATGSRLPFVLSPQHRS